VNKRYNNSHVKVVNIFYSVQDTRHEVIYKVDIIHLQLDISKSMVIFPYSVIKMELYRILCLENIGIMTRKLNNEGQMPVSR